MFNNCCKANFHPAKAFCVDEPMVCWHGIGGDWVNEGPLMCIAIDWKPNNGCEIQSACCGESGIMCQSEHVETSKARACTDDTATDSTLNEGTKAIKKLCLPWANTDRIAVANLHFASIQTARKLKLIGLQFIGVMKTATKRCPMDELSNCQFNNCGEHKSLCCTPTPELPDQSATCDMMAFAWVDRERRHFTWTCSPLHPSDPIL